MTPLTGLWYTIVMRISFMPWKFLCAIIQYHSDYVHGKCIQKEMIHTASKQAQQYAFDCSGPGDSGYELPGYRMNLLTHAMTYTSPLLCLTSKRQDVLCCSVYCNIRLLFYVAVTANINHITYQYCFLSAALPASLSNG